MIMAEKLDASGRVGAVTAQQLAESGSIAA
jgi:hypothetical protein